MEGNGKSILEDLFFGRLSNLTVSRPQDTQYDGLEAKIEVVIQHLKRVVPETEYKYFDELEDLNDELGTLYGLHHFKTGLSFGILLMTDIYDFLIDNNE